MTRPWLWSVLLLAPLVATGCEDTGFEQVDIAYFRFPDSSAGLVYELGAADLEHAPRWKVAHDAPTAVGDVEGGAAFGALTFALRLPDARLVAADGIGARVLIVDEAGTLVDEWGRKGAGPGEFQYPSWLGMCGSDGLFVFDRSLSRLTEFSRAGGVVDVVQLRPGGLRLRGPPACNQAGDMAVVGQLERPEELREGPFRPFVTLSVRIAADGEFHDVVRLPGPDSYRWPNQVGPLGEFGRRPVFAMADSTLFVATGDAFEIAEFDLDGNLLSLMRADDVQRWPVTSRDLEQVRREQLEATAPEFRPRLNRALTSMQWPEFHPVLEGLLIGSKGCLWVRHVQPASSLATWRVLTKSGIPVGIVQLPAQFTLTQATEREIVGYSEGPAGTDQIVAYRYERDGDSEC